ncbi:alpha methylacyl-CoA racemase [Viridothelium virens]|uniref:Alpha methylacyl-CoA racemase n=1 Tax=Viridothelium virens TaxID=1048519 RepID=A0A6A6GYV0_VIRVR|nr:alpha methylacyl-CoA racemase [Viridothelium virens]
MTRPPLPLFRLFTSHLVPHRLSGPPRQKSLDRSLSYSTVVEPAKNNGCLKGIRVLDLSRILAAPFCTQILADYGADVIKVEQPGTGDDTRHWKVHGEDQKWNKTEGPMSVYFTAVNRNKRSITLNLKKKEAKAVLFDLAKTSDVFIENFVPGKADELGIGYDSISKLNPRIVYASISGYGSTGPYATRAGYDAIAAAEGGLMHISGEKTGKPVRPGVGMMDMTTGLYTHGAILAALRARDQTGRGQRIDASLLESTLSILINIGVNWLNLGLEGQRYGSAHPSIAPYDTYETKNGYFAMGANNDRQFKVLCERFGCTELLKDERFATNPSRVQNRETIDGIMNDFCKQRTMEELMQILKGSGLAHGPVNSIERAFEHPQAGPRQMVQSTSCDAFENGEIRMIGPPVKFSENRSEIRARAPFLGEHTDEVLHEIGISDKRIEDLRAIEAI